MLLETQRGLVLQLELLAALVTGRCWFADSGLCWPGLWDLSSSTSKHQAMQPEAAFSSTHALQPSSAVNSVRLYRKVHLQVKKGFSFSFD
jgi:hypothetical protein